MYGCSSSVRYAPTPRLSFMGFVLALNASDTPRMGSAGACRVPPPPSESTPCMWLALYLTHCPLEGCERQWVCGHALLDGWPRRGSRGRSSTVSSPLAAACWGLRSQAAATQRHSVSSLLRVGLTRSSSDSLRGWVGVRSWWLLLDAGARSRRVSLETRSCDNRRTSEQGGASWRVAHLLRIRCEAASVIGFGRS